jgi:carboxyl-terminal processing protease
MKLISVTCLIVLIYSSYTHAQELRTMQFESFEEVWSTVYESHFDPSMNGVDWQAMYDLYKQDINLIESNDAFIKVANRMLFELQQSHALVASEEMLKLYMPTLFSPGTIGVDVRWLNGKVIMTRIREGFPGGLAGLKPGYELIKIDGETVESIINDMVPLPPFNERNLAGGSSNYLIGHLDGQPGTSTSIVYLDHKSNPREILLTRKSRGEGQIVNEAMPPVFVEFEAKMLDSNIGYVWFNHFANPVDQDFLDVLDQLTDTQGLIIDLRGNPGGSFKVVDTILRKLIGEETNIYHFRLREKNVYRVLKPADNHYKKPVAVIIDETSMSSSELFASCLQAIGRAVLIGKQSPGYLLGAQWKRLPNGLSFMYPFLQPIPINGYIVENNGVVPDIKIDINSNSLLEGKDSQVEAAIEYILKSGE